MNAGLFFKNEHAPQAILAAVDVIGADIVHFYATLPTSIVEVLDANRSLKAVVSLQLGDDPDQLLGRRDSFLQGRAYAVGRSKAKNLKESQWAMDTLGEDLFDADTAQAFVDVWLEHPRVANNLAPLLAAPAHIRERLYFTEYEGGAPQNIDRMKFQAAFTERLAEKGFRVCIWNGAGDPRIQTMKGWGTLEALRTHQGLLGYQQMELTPLLTPSLSAQLDAAGYGDIPLCATWLRGDTTNRAAYLTTLSSSAVILNDLPAHQRYACLYGVRVDEGDERYEVGSFLGEIRDVLPEAGEPSPDPQPAPVPGEISLPSSFKLVYPQLADGTVIEVTSPVYAQDGNSTELAFLRNRVAELEAALDAITALIAQHRNA
ncbi:MAG: hypothetical protein AMXMBFR13_48770 [Phycisphaerae bacterium]